MLLSFVMERYQRQLDEIHLEVASYCTPIDSKKTYVCLMNIQKLPTF